MTNAEQQLKLPFEPAVLTRYLRNHIDCGFEGAEAKITQISGGFSNPTYFLNYSDDADYVLRKKPEGKLLPKAHAVDREYRVMKALWNTDVPVPEVLHFCEDESIVGTPFYIMRKVEGRVLHENNLPSVDASERAAYFSAMNKTLADLHSVDYKAVGLESYGRAEGFIERQVGFWASQYEKSKTQEITEIVQLGRWLEEHIPDDNNSSIFHGDYRFGNIMVHPTEAKVVAVMDWELSTLGHPMCDLGYNLMMWKMNSDQLSGLKDLDLKALGIPAFEDYIAEYFKNRGLENNFNPFYLAFSLFRLAVIFDGINRRGASAGDGTDVSNYNKELAAIGLEVAKTP
jgi:aminoglycoside phosphotransferase (APT) family kinase protein